MGTTGAQEGIPQPVIKQRRYDVAAKQQGEDQQGDQYTQQSHSAEGEGIDASLHLALIAHG